MAYLFLGYLGKVNCFRREGTTDRTQSLPFRASRKVPRKLRFANTDPPKPEHTERQDRLASGTHFLLRTLSLLAHIAVQTRIPGRNYARRPSKASISIPLSARNQPSEGPASRSPSAFTANSLERRFGFLHFRHASNLVRPLTEIGKPACSSGLQLVKLMSVARG